VKSGFATKWAPRIHGGLATLWIILIIPTMMWWHDSILWVLLISIYANIVGHWSAYQAAHAEKTMQKTGTNSTTNQPSKTGHKSKKGRRRGY
jgi:hypothetical protein